MDNIEYREGLAELACWLEVAWPWQGDLLYWPDWNDDGTSAIGQAWMLLNTVKGAACVRAALEVKGWCIGRETELTFALDDDNGVEMYWMRYIAQHNPQGHIIMRGKYFGTRAPSDYKDLLKADTDAMLDLALAVMKRAEELDLV